MKIKYQCVRHRFYLTKEIAEKAMIVAIHKHKVNLTRVYKCNWCAGWHLTSK
jgi:hypothetical protein